jgi:hypothetical protein
LITLNLQPWNEDEKLSVSSKLALAKIITIEEIRKTVFDSNGDKAPGPSGLSF